MRIVLEHLEENDRRRLFAKRGKESLSAYCQKYINYTKDEANARISAMRLMREIPHVKEKLDDGDLNLTHLTLAKSLFNHKKDGYSTPEKRSEAPRKPRNHEQNEDKGSTPAAKSPRD